MSSFSASATSKASPSHLHPRQRPSPPGIVFDSQSEGSRSRSPNSLVDADGVVDPDCKDDSPIDAYADSTRRMRGEIQGNSRSLADRIEKEIVYDHHSQNSSATQRIRVSRLSSPLRRVC